MGFCPSPRQQPSDRVTLLLKDGAAPVRLHSMKQRLLYTFAFGCPACLQAAQSRAMWALPPPRLLALREMEWPFHSAHHATTREAASDPSPAKAKGAVARTVPTFLEFQSTSPNSRNALQPPSKVPCHLPLARPKTRKKVSPADITLRLGEAGDEESLSKRGRTLSPPFACRSKSAKAHRSPADLVGGAPFHCSKPHKRHLAEMKKKMHRVFKRESVSLPLSHSAGLAAHPRSARYGTRSF
ncbi:hypothetical protein ERJ75_000088500 [Trypanosoma vivax]|nr:hypothetical protein ERJ75_000088500 [Trypanosoma vivax]